MKPFRIGFSSVIAMLAFAGPHVALAQEARAPAPGGVRRVGPARIFSMAGHLAISSDAGLAITNTSIDGQDGSTTTIQMRPSVDYFLIDELSLGGFLGLDYTNQAGDAGHTTTFSIGPRVGYNIMFSDIFSLWPKVGFSFAATSISQNVVSTVNGVPVVTSESTDTSSLALNLFVPFMVHPAEHFFVGFGPAFDLDLTGDNKATTVAGRLTLGGWI